MMITIVLAHPRRHLLPNHTSNTSVGTYEVTTGPNVKLYLLCLEVRLLSHSDKSGNVHYLAAEIESQQLEIHLSSDEYIVTFVQSAIKGKKRLKDF